MRANLKRSRLVCGNECYDCFMGIDIVGFFKEHKEEILGALAIMGGAMLMAMSDSDSEHAELTNGQKLDLSEAVEAVSWNFGEGIEYAYASDDSVCFVLVDDEYENIYFTYSTGEWDASYCDVSEDVEDAVKMILDRLNERW